MSRAKFMLNRRSPVGTRNLMMPSSFRGSACSFLIRGELGNSPQLAATRLPLPLLRYLTACCEGTSCL
jgi:hypothetical protein